MADLAYVTELTPAAVPYARGATYRPLLTKLVPRALWRNGPQEVAGQWYGHRYKFLDPEDTATSVNLPVVTEGWINGGWIGVIGSAALLGIVLRIIWTGVDRREQRAGERDARHGGGRVGDGPRIEPEPHPRRRHSRVPALLARRRLHSANGSAPVPVPPHDRPQSLRRGIAWVSAVHPAPDILSMRTMRLFALSAT